MCDLEVYCFHSLSRKTRRSQTFSKMSNQLLLSTFYQVTQWKYPKVINFCRRFVFILIYCGNFKKTLQCVKYKDFNPGSLFTRFFRPGTKFHPCAYDRDEITPGWNFIPSVTCKHYMTFSNRQGWTHPGTNLVPGWDLTCKQGLGTLNHMTSWNMAFGILQVLNLK